VSEEEGGGDRAQRPMAVEWRDRRGSHLKLGGSSNTSTRQEQDGCLSPDRERRQRRRREWDPRDTAAPPLPSVAYPRRAPPNYKAQPALRTPIFLLVAGAGAVLHPGCKPSIVCVYSFSEPNKRVACDFCLVVHFVRMSFTVH
jgi:hypothetical protein